jgi:hypothetical protein
MQVTEKKKEIGTQVDRRAWDYRGACDSTEIISDARQNLTARRNLRNPKVPHSRS